MLLPIPENCVDATQWDWRFLVMIRSPILVDHMTSTNDVLWKNANPGRTENNGGLVMVRAIC